MSPEAITGFSLSRTHSVPHRSDTPSHQKAVIGSCISPSTRPWAFEQYVAFRRPSHNINTVQEHAAKHGKPVKIPRATIVKELFFATCMKKPAQSAQICDDSPVFSSSLDCMKVVSFTHGNHDRLPYL